jgi:prepilin-type processing-associated H-X9-DG protein
MPPIAGGWPRHGHRNRLFCDGHHSGSRQWSASSSRKSGSTGGCEVAKHLERNWFSLIVGVSILLGAAQLVRPPSITGHQLPHAGIGVASSHKVDSALKADKLMVAKPQTVEPGPTQLPRPDVRSSQVKIGCERPFSVMASIRSDVAGRCIASMADRHSSPA